MNITNGSPRPSYTARDFNTIQADLIAYVAHLRPDLLPDFQNEQGLGPFLLDLVALVGDTCSFAIDQAALAVFLTTTLQYETALRFARSVGYVPRSAIAATVVVTGPVPDAIIASGGTIPAGSAIAGPNGTSFYLVTDYVIAVSVSTVSITLTEGTPHTETFVTTSIPWFTVRTASGVVADDSWAVYVGDPTNPANLWTQVDNVALEASSTNTYQIEFDGQGRLLIQFGDGSTGAIPAQNVTVQYSTTDGDAGNVAMLALSGTFVATVAGTSTIVAVPVSNAGGPATGGADRETIAEMQVNIPAFIRSSGKLTTIADYSAAPLNVAGVAAAFAELAVASYRGNVVNVNVWQSLATQFYGEGNTPVNLSIVPYLAFAVAGSSLVTAVQNYLRSITSVTVFPQVLQPPVAFADLYVNTLTYNKNFTASVVHAAVTAAVINVFQSSDGFSIRLSDLYNAIRNVAGVVYFTLDRMVFQYSSKTKAYGTVIFTAGIQPAVGDTLTINDGTVTNTFEFTLGGPPATAANIAVFVGISAHDTMVNLVQAVNYNMETIVAAKTSATIPTMTLTQTLGGTAFNIPITNTGTVLSVVGMSGGSDTVVTVLEDRRQSTYSPANPDPWPPGSYTPGSPYTGSTPWQDGGLLPYLPMADLTIPVDKNAQNYYETAYVYNNEIVYNNAAQESIVPQVINLRRLLLNMIAQ